MAEKTIKHASFWYVTADGVGKTAMRGDTVDITRDEDVARGERHGAFASKEDLADGAPLAAFMAARATATPPASVMVDPSEVESRTSVAGSSDPRIQSGMVEPSGTTSKQQNGDRPAGNASRETWAAYATTKGAPETETAPVEDGGLSRDDLRTKYGA